MKLPVLATLLALAAAPCLAQDAGKTAAPETHSPAAAERSTDEFSQVTDAKIAGWGRAVDTDGDCKFFLSKSALIISTPASARPHDFSPEMDLTNAPRVMRTVSGDFTLQVQVDDRMHPGADSTMPGRVGYNGAAVVVLADELNAVTLARAVIKPPGEERVPYGNFEIRTNGELHRIGYTSDCELPKTGPVFLRLERRGQQITGSVSTDGSKWSVVGSETIPDDWTEKLKAGVMVVNTSKGDFSPQFSNLQVSK